MITFTSHFKIPLGTPSPSLPFAQLGSSNVFKVEIPETWTKEPEVVESGVQSLLHSWLSTLVLAVVGCDILVSPYLTSLLRVNILVLRQSINMSKTAFVVTLNMVGSDAQMVAAGAAAGAVAVPSLALSTYAPFGPWGCVQRLWQPLTTKRLQCTLNWPCLQVSSGQARQKGSADHTLAV